jgi:hypothetical protein
MRRFLKRVIMMDKKVPVFVKIEEYEEILNILDVIKHKIEVTKTTLGKLKELKGEEDREIEAWTANLDNISRKMIDIDKTLFGVNE